MLYCHPKRSLNLIVEFPYNRLSDHMPHHSPAERRVAAEQELPEALERAQSEYAQTQAAERGAARRRLLDALIAFSRFVS